MKISVVIPNWNGSELLKKHLPKVISLVGRESEILVVDDGSTDNSREIIGQFKSVRLIEKENHEGFASTVNIGVQNALGEVIILLNTDVEPEQNFLHPLIANFKDPLVFAVGCMDKSMEEGTIVMRGRGEAAWKKGFFVHWKGDTNKKNTAWVSGGSGAFRKNIWDKLHGMDELYNPFYWEDIDLSYRALKAGYRLIFEPKSVVEHFHEEGKIKTNFSSFRIKQIAYRNQFIFIWKNLSDGKILLQHCFWTPIRLVQAVLRGDMAFIIGYINAVFLLPSILHSRMESLSMWKRSDRELAPSLI